MDKIYQIFGDKRDDKKNVWKIFSGEKSVKMWLLRLQIWNFQLGKHVATLILKPACPKVTWSSYTGAGYDTN